MFSHKHMFMSDAESGLRRANFFNGSLRDLYKLGFGSESLDTIGAATREWVLVGLGNEVHSELRGLKAGYSGAIFRRSLLSRAVVR